MTKCGCRKARRRKLGLPEELTPEELEEEKRKAEEKAAEEAKRKLPVKPVSRISKMREILVSIKKAGHAEVNAVFL
jgi:UBX domain-containing protein 1/4